MNADELREKIAEAEKNLQWHSSKANSNGMREQHERTATHCKSELASLRKQLEELTESKP